MMWQEGDLPETLDGIANRFNEWGWRTNRIDKVSGDGNLFDAKKVHAALLKLGVDRTSIKRWANTVRRLASDWDVDHRRMLQQLWFDWLSHESAHWGAGLPLNEIPPFVPRYLHPDKWDGEEWRFIDAGFKMNWGDPIIAFEQPVNGEEKAPVSPRAAVVHIFLKQFSDPF